MESPFKKTEPASLFTGLIPQMLDQLQHVILGKENSIRLCLACLLARGHLLIEDIPGVGKTTLAQALARTLGLSYQRIQFTSDMLPADILGASVYERDSGKFRFYPGPIFSQLILADEVNRATPKTQSALLEAMEEHQVTAEAETYRLPKPFFVVATQNPADQIGTFPLPESQLDRFLMRVELGYPDAQAERELLRGQDRRHLLAGLAAVTEVDSFLALQTAVDEVHVSEALLDYLQALVRHSRECRDYENGLSPRAALALKRAAQAWALMQGHPGVLPEDIQAVLPGVATHRLRLKTNPGQRREQGTAARLLEAVPLP